MQQIFKKIARNIKSIYHKAEDLIEEERELPLSQNLLNATIQKYVTDNVTALQDLHADIYDDWCRLYATLDYKGLNPTLSVDLRLVQMQLDKDIQCGNPPVLAREPEVKQIFGGAGWQEWGRGRGRSWIRAIKKPERMLRRKG